MEAYLFGASSGKLPLADYQRRRPAVEAMLAKLGLRVGRRRRLWSVRRAGSFRRTDLSAKVVHGERINKSYEGASIDGSSEEEAGDAMTDWLMTPNDMEEALSRAYVAAVAAGAGYVTAEQNLDRDGVDVQIRAGGSMRPSLDIQLKATINLGEATDGEYRYALKRRNYDLLREQTMVPRILVVLSLPTAEADWMSVTPDQLILRRCAFWVSLAGFPETENNESVTISIHNNNRLDVDSLRALMERARSGAIA